MDNLQSSGRLLNRNASSGTLTLRELPLRSPNRLLLGSGAYIRGYVLEERGLHTKVRGRMNEGEEEDGGWMEGGGRRSEEDSVSDSEAVPIIAINPINPRSHHSRAVIAPSSSIPPQPPPSLTSLSPCLTSSPPSLTAS